MTTNQTNQLVKSPNTKKALAVLTKYAALELQLKQAKAEADAAGEQIKQAMLDNNIAKLEGDWGYITLAERTSYKAEDISQVGKSWIKPTLDADKVKATVTLTGLLPIGVLESKTQYLTKRFKVVE